SPFRSGSCASHGQGAPITAADLSPTAFALFRLARRAARQVRVDGSTREAYRKLLRHGLMRAGSTFRDGLKEDLPADRTGVRTKNGTGIGAGVGAECLAS